MFHFFRDIRSAKGPVLIGYYVKAIDTSDGSVVDIYADDSSTPIVSVSGVANAAKVDSNGNVSFYIVDGEYHLDIYATDATTHVLRVDNVPMANPADAATLSELALDTGAGLIGSTNGNTAQEEFDRFGGTSSLGALATGTTSSISVQKTATGDSGGATDWRHWLYKTQYEGGYGATQVLGANYQMEIRHTAGVLGQATGILGYTQLGLAGSVTTTGTATRLSGFEWHIANEGNNNASSAYVLMAEAINLADGTGQIGTTAGIYLRDQGHATRVTSAAYGAHVENFTAGAPITAAYSSAMASGTNKWGLYFSGSAKNVLNGQVRIGDTTAPSDMLEVKGYAKLTNSGTITATGSYHELLSSNNDYVAHVRSTHASAPHGLRIRFTAAAPNDTTQNFLLCEDSGGTKAIIYSSGGASFSGQVSVPDDAYDATAWNGSTAVPTKNAVRDKIESLSLGGGTTTNALTMNNGGAGAASGSTFNGSSAVTISYNTIGAQPLNATLTALAAFNTNGLLTQTAADTFTGRTLTGPAAGITVSNGNGVSGNPTLALANDLSAVEGLSSNGIATRTATDAWTVRSLQGTSNEISVTNGSGVSGDPTISLATGLLFSGKTITGGSITPESTPTTTAIGYLGSPINTQNGAYTTVMSDAGKTIYHTSASTHTWTIDSNANVAYPIGTVIGFINESGGGNVTIAITSDTLRWGSSTGSRTLAANGTATAIKVASTTWRLTGDGIT